MIELENMIELDNEKYTVLLNKQNIQELKQSDYSRVEKIWINENILLNKEEIDFINQFQFEYIPRNYFAEELREAGE